MPPVFLHVKSFISSPLAYARAWQRYLGYGTQAERWSQPTSFNENWDVRTRMLAAMVAPGSAVLEFGSGRETLEAMLPPGCYYQPSDIVKRSPRTLVCDLNAGFPLLDRRFDVVIFSGVIEYIRDLDRLFKAVRSNAGGCIVSYATTDALESMTTRLNNAWVNHLSDAQLRKLFARSGFTVAEVQRWQEQTIFQLT